MIRALVLAVVLTACGSNQAVAPATASHGTEPPVEPATEFESVLLELGVDLAGAPEGVLGRADQQICGPEQLDQHAMAAGRLDGDARRCFLDAHVAGLPAALASVQPTHEGDPIVSIWLTSAEGVAHFIDSTRDANGSGTWSVVQPCGRFTTVLSTTPAALPPTEFSCHPGPSLGATDSDDAVPSWFRDRPALPLCGFAVDVEDFDANERQCFVDAVNASAPAEFVYGTTEASGQRVARWTRTPGDGTIEILETRTAENVARSWHRFACSGTGFVEDVDPADRQLARVDSTCQLVESSPVDASAPATTHPDPTPPGCAPEPTIELVSDDGQVTMDVVHYGEHTDTCGWDVDGDAVFDDAFRPATAVFAPSGQLAVVPDQPGHVSVDVRQLEPDMRLAGIDASDQNLVAGDDGSNHLTIPGPGCFVVSVAWSDGARAGAFVGLAESTIGACAGP